MEFPIEEVSSKNELVKKLNSYATNPDDDILRFKEKIKRHLLNCPELLYALNNKKYESELFNDDGSLNTEGEWDLYFGDNIRPYLFIPTSESTSQNYLCYSIGFTESPRYNDKEYFCQITFTIFCEGKDAIDQSTNMPRHDLIASILRERFNWSNVFSNQVKIVSNREMTTDNNYVTRTVVFQGTLPASMYHTVNGRTQAVNHYVQK